MKKALSILSAFITATLITFMLSGFVYAFHEGGVGYCEGCHIQHNPEIAQINDTDLNANARMYMLRGPDPSSTCLLCHAGQGKLYNVLSGDGSIYTPGGDFYWLKKTFTFIVNNMPYKSDGDSHGHNVVASDYGLREDQAMTSASGGVYSAAAMGCTSCHNAHGTTTGNSGNTRAISISGSYGETAPDGTIAGNFRLLGGAGYSGGNQAGVAFIYPAPVAVANSKNWTETDSNHTAYGSGMSEWCGNCHSDLLSSGNKHPADNSSKLGSAVISNYNSYVRTGDVSGIKATAYLSLVPFESGTTDKTLLDPSSTSGPDMGGNANVMCLTCHRAHAAAFQHLGRWDFQTTFLADSHPQEGDGGVTGNEITHSYYGRNIVAEFGGYQRQLCNKCHQRD
ncbi:MAG: cytochrome C [Nitrospirae bacterium]|nr:cytochrome C [Nitrospirota bacterium]